MSAPIIFIHYGNSEYLNYTLRCAVKFNKDKKIYLLGDLENKHYESIGIHHVEFKNLHFGEEIEKFEESFKLVKGTLHEFNKYKGTDFWLKFVFIRWFYINNFLKENSISSFWTFDSDTLIITELVQYEKQLEKFDCTEQCGGICFNGFVRNAKIVDGYINHINELFNDEEYLTEQQNEFEINKNYAFTEMRAYESYRNKSEINTVKLSRVSDDEMFDDCLCYDEGMETITLKSGQSFKKLFRDKKSKLLFVYSKSEERYIKMNTLNLSWLALYVIEEIYSKIPSLPINNISSQVLNTNLVPLEFKNNIFYKVRRKIKRTFLLS